MKNLIPILVGLFILLSSCETFYERQLTNTTPYDITFYLHYYFKTIEKKDVLRQHVKAHNVLEVGQDRYRPSFFSSSGTPKNIDSLILEIRRHDTLYRLPVYDINKSEFFQCLTGYSPETCTLEQSDLEGAKLIHPKPLNEN